MINTGPWAMQWEQWLCGAKKVNTFPHLPPYIIRFPITERMQWIIATALRIFLHLRRPAALYITSTAQLELHPLACQKLWIGIDPPCHNYSSVSVIYCCDNGVGCSCGGCLVWFWVAELEFRQRCVSPCFFFCCVWVYISQNWFTTF